MSERDAIREVMDEIASCDCEGDECALASMVNREVAAVSNWRTRLAIRFFAILLILFVIPGIYVCWLLRGRPDPGFHNFGEAYRDWWRVLRTGELE